VANRKHKQVQSHPNPRPKAGIGWQGLKLKAIPHE
jgi:hypothetical protein